MRIPKRYGQSKILNCPFCDKTAVCENSQGIPVCSKHKNQELDIKCACGSWLEIRKGKWGPYFHCINCGNINFKKALEMSTPIKKEIPKSKPTKTMNTNPKEITITSDEIGINY